MKVPVTAPSIADLTATLDDSVVSAALLRSIQHEVGPEVRGKYEHWDHLRHLQPPAAGLDVRTWWLRIKIARASMSRSLPLLDKDGNDLRVSLTNSMQRKLHFIDREAAGKAHGLASDGSTDSTHSYLIRSLMEEAMTSSQLEGASTTREVAKEMLKTRRQPRDRSEQMIYNNFRAMEQLRHWRDQPLSPAAVFEMHRILTADALDDPDQSGRFRRTDEQIQVMDPVGTVLHTPPPAHQLPERMQRLCDFANASDEESFLHPVVRAIAVHFQIGYDHPFVDGNGRVARALFYWCMLRSGYWLTEYLSISSVIKKAPAQYARAFLYTETDESDLGYFVAHQLDVIERAVEGLCAYIERKAAERKHAEALLKPTSRLGGRLNHRQRALLLNAVRNPGKQFRIALHQQAHDITYETARTDLQGLAGLGLMRQSRSGNAYVYTAVPTLEKKLGS